MTRRANTDAPANPIRERFPMRQVPTEPITVKVRSISEKLRLRQRPKRMRMPGRNNFTPRSVEYENLRRIGPPQFIVLGLSGCVNDLKMQTRVTLARTHIGNAQNFTSQRGFPFMNSSQIAVAGAETRATALVRRASLRGLDAPSPGITSCSLPHRSTPSVPGRAISTASCSDALPGLRILRRVEDARQLLLAFRRGRIDQRSRVREQ